MKVVVLGTRGFPHVQGGIEKHCEELYPRLVKLGCDVTVFTRTPYIAQQNRTSEWQGVKFIHLWCPKQKSFEAITHTFLGILKTRAVSPDILHIHAIGPSLLTPLGKLLGLRVIMTHHGPDYERAKWGKLSKAVLMEGERLGISFSDNIIAISKGIKEHIKERYGKQSVFIPNGVSEPSLLQAGEELARWRLEPKRYIFTACRFVPEKGLHDLIQAYRLIHDPPFKLVIAGDTDHETDYSKNLKRQAADASGVILTGFISGKRLQELYTNAGLFVLPSYYEGLPIALLEALSYELPVLVSDIQQHKEIPLREMRYFKTGNINSLSSAIMHTYLKGIAESEKEEYRSLIKESYNWDNIAVKTLSIYKDVVK